MTKDPRDSNKFMLRLPEGMRDQIAALAKENGRSMNSEIVARLQETIDKSNETDTVLAQMNDSMAKMAAATERLDGYMKLYESIDQVLKAIETKAAAIGHPVDLKAGLRSRQKPKP